MPPLPSTNFWFLPGAELYAGGRGRFVSPAPARFFGKPLLPRYAGGARPDQLALHLLDPVGGLLPANECREMAGAYDHDALFRSRVVMGRHGFGRGEYRYYAYPLPDPIAALRPALYARLAPVANRWNERMGMDVRFPEDHAAFLDRCHAAGQVRPTPLLLRRRRIRPYRATPPDANPRRRRASAARRRGGVRRLQPPRRGHARKLPREDAARCQQVTLGQEAYAGGHLPRCSLIFLPTNSAVLHSIPARLCSAALRSALPMR